MKVRRVLSVGVAVCSAVFALEAIAVSEGQTFNLKKEEVIVYGSDGQIWRPEAKGQVPGSRQIKWAEDTFANNTTITLYPLEPGAIKKSLKPGKYVCNAATFGGDPARGAKKFCKGMDDLARNSVRPSIAGNAPRYGNKYIIYEK
jgi:hypothetical protein